MLGLLLIEPVVTISPGHHYTVFFENFHLFLLLFPWGGKNVKRKIITPTAYPVFDAINKWMNEWTNERTTEWINEWMHACMHVKKKKKIVLGLLLIEPVVTISPGHNYIIYFWKFSPFSLIISLTFSPSILSSFFAHKLEKTPLIKITRGK